MSTYHTVQQGEHITRIAKKYGFRNHITIWNHSNNAELKKKRQNPNVLFPGDRLYIPDKEAKREARPTGYKHRFQLTGPPLTLRLVVEDLYRRPLANANCELRVENKVYKLLSDEKGRVEQQVPFDAEKAELLIKDVETPLKEKKLQIKIGHLDPVEEVSGQIARLNNLGYFAGPIEPINKRMFRSAVEEFQCDHSLTVDGVCGPVTQAKLKKVHGC